MIDLYKHKGLRKKLVEEIQRKGITDKNILSAMLKIPRHFFIGQGFEARAYQDNAFPIENGQTISQPYTVAFQTQLLNIQERDKVLEIGTGSGYQTAILCELGANVYTIERQHTLFKSAQIMLTQLQYTPYCKYGDGHLGIPGYAPFDKILITAGATQIPKQLLLQLKTGGIMVAPIGQPNNQEMLQITKVSPTKYKVKKHGKFNFVPFLTGTN